MLQLYIQVTFFILEVIPVMTTIVDGPMTNNIYGDGVIIDATLKKDFDEITVNNIQLDMRG